MFPKTSELFEFNKMIFIYLITIIILFVWLLKMLLFRKFFLKRTFFDLFIILFLISQLISTFFSIDKHTSIFGYYGRFNGGLLSILTYIILYYGIASNLTASQIKKILKISLLSSLLTILWGLPGKFGYDLSCYLFTSQLNNTCWTDQFKPAERIFSTLGQPNWLGAYLAINFFIGLYFLIISEGKNKIFLNLYLLINFIAILFTRSRSAFLATVFCLAFYLTLIIFFKKKLFQIEIKEFIAFLILICFLTLLIGTGIEAVDRYLNVNNLIKSFIKQKSEVLESKKNNNIQINVTASSDIRKIVWKGAVELGKKYPLFGTGVETFAYAYYFVRPAEHNLTSEWDYLYNKAHNEFLNYLATTGFFGLISYLVFIFSVFIYVLKSFHKGKNHNLLVINLLLAWITILITNFFGFSTTTINLFFYLIPGFLIILLEKQEKNNEMVVDVNNLRTDQFIELFLAFLFAFYLIIKIFNYWQADILYAEADIYQKKGYYQTAIKKLQQALTLKYEPIYEDKLSYCLANLAYGVSLQEDKKIINELINLSQFYNNHSIKSSPKNVLFYKTKAKNNYLFYQITLDKKYLTEAIKTLDYTQKLSPTDPKIPYTKAIFYILLVDEIKDKNKKDEAQKLALKNLDQAIILKKDFRDAYFAKAKFLKKIGKNEEANKIFKYILNNINPLDSEVKEELKNN
jgi:O-antigen ligase/tetratricopeptide (TPR) repeat protein